MNPSLREVLAVASLTAINALPSVQRKWRIQFMDSTDSSGKFAPCKGLTRSGETEFQGNLVEIERLLAHFLINLAIYLRLYLRCF